MLLPLGPCGRVLLERRNNSTRSAPDADVGTFLVERFGVECLELFGSVSRGDATGRSDIDVLYTLLPSKELGWFIEDLASELSELFGRPMDLVARSAVHPRLRSTILSDAQPLYAA